MDWTGREVVVIGAGRQGLALARYLTRHGARVTINDRQPAAALESAQRSLADVPVSWVLGGHPLEVLAGADVVCVSGGVPLDLPLVQAARRRGIPLTNDSQIFLESAPCRVIGITGSSGKSTTTVLVGRIAAAALSGPDARSHANGREDARQVWVGGNLGQPLLGFLDEMGPQDLAVMELSSFQLLLMDRSPPVAAVLNITPNHLDRHGTMAAYTAAKARILHFQGEGDAAVLNHRDPGAWGLRDQVRGRLLAFGRQSLPDGVDGAYLRGEVVVIREGGMVHEVMPASEIRLPGEHNRMNVLAACAIAAAAGLSPAAMRRGVQGFESLPHRLELVRSWRGVDWVNDSIATAPERAIAAIRAYDRPLVLLAGGQDKDLPWGELAALVRRRVDHVVAFGEAADTVAAALEAAPSEEGRGPTLAKCPDLRTAVQTAADLAESGDVVLLSPGGTSFDEFRDFEERGERFKQWVRELS